MKELSDNVDNKGSDEAQDIHIFFDDNAWDKIETLLNEDDKNEDAGSLLRNYYPN